MFNCFLEKIPKKQLLQNVSLIFLTELNCYVIFIFNVWATDHLHIALLYTVTILVLTMIQFNASCMHVEVKNKTKFIIQNQNKFENLLI
jgi:hypothetical protein